MPLSRARIAVRRPVARGEHKGRRPPHDQLHGTTTTSGGAFFPEGGPHWALFSAATRGESGVQGRCGAIQHWMLAAALGGRRGGPLRCFTRTPSEGSSRVWVERNEKERAKKKEEEEAACGRGGDDAAGETEEKERRREDRRDAVAHHAGIWDGRVMECDASEEGKRTGMLRSPLPFFTLHFLKTEKEEEEGECVRPPRKSGAARPR